jgi:hypothetical protein
MTDFSSVPLIPPVLVLSHLVCPFMGGLNLAAIELQTIHMTKLPLQKKRIEDVICCTRSDLTEVEHKFYILSNFKLGNICT